MSYLCSVYLFLLYSSVNLILSVYSDDLISNKCCPNNEIALTKYYELYNCTPHSQLENNDSFAIYDYYFEDNDVFVLNDLTLDNLTLIYNPDITKTNIFLQPETYLSKDGYVYTKKRGTWKTFDRQQWLIFSQDEFCIDYYIEIIQNDTGLDIFIRNNVLPEKNNTFTSIALSLSSFFFALVLIIYVILPELHNVHGLILMSYITCEIIGFTCFVITLEMKYSTEVMCKFFSIIVYYFLLAGFFWMNVMSFDIWRTFRGYITIRSLNRQSVRLKYYLYCLFAFGVPLIMTIFFVTVTFMDMSDLPGFQKPILDGQCFMTDDGIFLYLYVPMLILLSANSLLYIMTVYNIWRVQRGTSVLNTMENRTHQQQKQRFFLYLKLSVVMGLNWIIEVLGVMYPESLVVYYANYYNAFTGIFVFIIFICKKKIFRMLKKRFKDIIVFRKRSSFKFDSIPTSSNTSMTLDSDDVTSSSNLALQVCYNPNGRSE